MRLTEYVLLLMREQGCCHSDITPATARLFSVNGRDSYEVRVVNFDVLAKNPTHSPIDPNDVEFEAIQEGPESHPTNPQSEESYKSGFYSVIRTVQRLVVDESSWREEFLLDSSLDESDKLASLSDRIVDSVRGDSTQSHFTHDLESIVNFIKRRGLHPSNYRIGDVQALLNELRSSEHYESHYSRFCDEEQVVRAVQRAQKQESASCDTLAVRLFGLNPFVRHRGCSMGHFDEDFDLVAAVKSFVSGWLACGGT